MQHTIICPCSHPLWLYLFPEDFLYVCLIRRKFCLFVYATLIPALSFEFQK